MSPTPLWELFEAEGKRMDSVGLAQTKIQIGKWVAKRDRLIREAHQEGVPLRAIGEAAGLSHTAVAKILRRSLKLEERDIGDEDDDLAVGGDELTIRPGVGLRGVAEDNGLTVPFEEHTPERLTRFGGHEDTATETGLQDSFQPSTVRPFDS